MVEIGSGFEELGGTPLTRISRSTPRGSYAKIGDCEKSSFAASPLNKSVVTTEAPQCVNKRLEDVDTQPYSK